MAQDRSASPTLQHGYRDARFLRKPTAYRRTNADAATNTGSHGALHPADEPVLTSSAIPLHGHDGPGRTDHAALIG